MSNRLNDKNWQAFSPTFHNTADLSRELEGIKKGTEPVLPDQSLSVHEHLDLSNFLDGFKAIREFGKSA